MNSLKTTHNLSELIFLFINIIFYFDFNQNYSLIY